MFISVATSIIIIITTTWDLGRVVPEEDLGCAGRDGVRGGRGRGRVGAVDIDGMGSFELRADGNRILGSRSKLADGSLGRARRLRRPPDESHFASGGTD